APGEARRIPGWVIAAVSALFAFAHAGKWVHQELSGPCCARCRRRRLAFAAGAGLAALFVVSMGLAVWLHRP
ncbi:MAG: hypothetical protein KGM24_13455, partial [Elusimicrobia bacterium]|nr:hypothetical protein [Elusimicrobiota bacterium]